MKSIQLLAAGIILLLSASSCTKEKTDMPGDAVLSAKKKVKTILEVFPDGSSEQTTYDYDDKGKLVKVISEESIQEIQYNVNGFDMYVKSTLKSDPNVYRNEEITLNDKGAISKQTTKYANGTVLHQDEYFYNADGILTKVLSSIPANPNLARNEFEIQNGVVASSKFYTSGNLLNSTVYTYDISKTLKSYEQEWRVYPIPGFTGKLKNHPITTNKVYDAAGQLTRSCVYSYLYNAEGDCSKISWKDELSGKESSITITYQ